MSSRLLRKKHNLFFDSSVLGTIAKQQCADVSFFFLLHKNKSAEIEHGWNDNHHSDDRLNMTRNSERRKGKNKERDSFFFVGLFFKKTNALM